MLFPLPVINLREDLEVFRVSFIIKRELPSP